jgi:hypothetical protein
LISTIVLNEEDSVSGWAEAPTSISEEGVVVSVVLFRGEASLTLSSILSLSEISLWLGSGWAGDINTRSTSLLANQTISFTGSTAFWTVLFDIEVAFTSIAVQDKVRSAFCRSHNLLLTIILAFDSSF